MVLDKDLPQPLFTALDELITDVAKRQAMAQAMSREGRPDALAKIVKAGLELIKEIK